MPTFLLHSTDVASAQSILQNGVILASPSNRRHISPHLSSSHGSFYNILSDATVQAGKSGMETLHGNLWGSVLFLIDVKDVPPSVTISLFACNGCSHSERPLPSSRQKLGFSAARLLKHFRGPMTLSHEVLVESDLPVTARTRIFSTSRAIQARLSKLTRLSVDRVYRHSTTLMQLNSRLQQ